jgi:hypothetical protein
MQTFTDTTYYINKIARERQTAMMMEYDATGIVVCRSQKIERKNLVVCICRQSNKVLSFLKNFPIICYDNDVVFLNISATSSDIEKSSTVQDLADKISSIAKKLKSPRVILYGNSLEGYYAYTLAARIPNSSCIIFSPGVMSMTGERYEFDDCSKIEEMKLFGNRRMIAFTGSNSADIDSLNTLKRLNNADCFYYETIEHDLFKDCGFLRFIRNSMSMIVEYVSTPETSKRKKIIFKNSMIRRL